MSTAETVRRNRASSTSALDWTAAMIGPERDLDGAPLLSRRFALDEGHGAVTDARLWITAYGVFEARVNGVPVAEDLLQPGWSSYEWRIRVVQYDVAALLRPQSELTVLLGNGWYRGRLTWEGKRALYGPDLGASAQLMLTYTDGHQQHVVTDDRWTAEPSAVLTDDLYDGETVDARRSARRGPAIGVKSLPFDPALLVDSATPPIRRQSELAVLAVLRCDRDSVLLDFGQNLVGWLRLKVRGPEGARLTVRHAEVLEQEQLSVRPLRSAEATDRYVLSGGEDEFEPTFTFHGFRYAEITGWPGTFTPEAVTAVVVHSDLERIGTFSCSDPLLNRLHENIVWGTRGNFVGIPSDCPQRDERLGWTGDIAVFAPTAAFLFDVRAFLGDWLVDLALEQEHGGVVPSVVPDVLKDVTLPFADTIGTTAIWSDAAVWVPAALWNAYGDRALLERSYDSMATHTRSVAAGLSPEGLWEVGFQYGDWLDPDASPHRPWEAKVEPAVVATACAYRTARLAADAATVLGRDQDRVEFIELAGRLRTAFNRHYVDGGRVRSDAATGYTLAIVFGLLDGTDLDAAGDRLAELVERAGYRVSTGFAGTPFICEALSSTGHLQAAYRLLLEREMPSWLYPVTMGATTVWERWDSMLPDGSINPGEMTSFNHYALGSVADWMHRTIGGIAPLEPGYRRIRVAPRPGGGITEAHCSLQTPNGLLSADWRLADGTFILDLEVPPCAVAEVDLPDGSNTMVGSGPHRFAVPTAEPR